MGPSDQPAGAPAGFRVGSFNIPTHIENSHSSRLERGGIGRERPESEDQSTGAKGQSNVHFSRLKFGRRNHSRLEFVGRIEAGWNHLKLAEIGGIG